MSLPSLKIDDELQRLIPPLTDDEYNGLEESILSEGVRDPIIVWAGHDTIVDGHNRYRICQKHGITFGVFEKRFADKVAVIEWMRSNQLSRRNLTPGQKAALEIDVSEAKLREEARLKKVEDGKRTGALAHKSPTQEGADQLVGTLFPEQSDTTQDEDNQPVAHANIDAVEQPKAERSQPKQARNRDRDSETAHKLAGQAGVGVGTVKRVMAVKQSGDSELYDRVRSGEVSANKAFQEVQRRKRDIVSSEIEPGQAILNVESGVGKCQMCDLLITEPDETPPSEWLYQALSGVRRTGFAYVFIDPTPQNMLDYLNAGVPMNVELDQILVWSFDYIVGNNDWTRYKPSWKAILFYRGMDAGNLRFPYIKERNAVQDVKAEGGELGKPGYDLRMPMELAERLIKQSTKDGDTVFDPFARHGTFLVAAKKLGRDAIGYERDENMASEALKRGVRRE